MAVAESLDEAIKMLQWGVDNNIKSLADISSNFNISSDFFFNRKRRGKRKDRYDEFIKLYKIIIQRNMVRVNNKGYTKPPEANEKEKDKKQSPPETENTKYSESNDGTASYEYTGKEDIRDLEDAIKHFKIDTTIWEITNFVCSSSQVSALYRDQDLQWDGVNMYGHAVRKPEWHKSTNFSVKIFLKKRATVVAAFDFKSFYLDLLKKERPKSFDRIKYKPTSDHILEVNLFDLHLGKLCWKGEVGYDYDSAMASDRFMYALNTLVVRAGEAGFKKVIFPIGNDFFNSDTMWDETTAGTKQSDDSRWQKTYKRGTELLIEGIEYMRQFAPVHALIVPGNHDEQRSFFMGETLAAYYRNNKDVTVDNSPNPRKYVEFGNVLIGYTHGDKEKSEALRSLMAFEAKQAWARTKYKEFHCGHWHRKLSTKTVTLAKIPLVNEELGIIVRHMGSMSGTDAWHHKHGYIGPIKSSQSLLWSEEHGLIAEFNVNIDIDSKRWK